MSRTKKFLSETAWYGLFAHSKTVLQIGSSFVLARVLTPADFGLVSMVTVLISFSSLFVDLGMTTAYIQKLEVEETHTNALFLQTTIAGALIAGLLVAARTWIVDFYHEPGLNSIVLGMAVSLFIGAFAATPTAMMRRQSRFKQIGMIGVAGFVISFVVTVASALAGAGAMSIVYGLLARDVLSAFATSRDVGWVPSIRTRRADFVELFRVGGWLSLTRFLGFFTRSTDTILVGKLYSASILGIYNRAYAIMALPLTKLSGLVAVTALPTLKDFQEDNERLYRALEKIIVTELVILIPVVLYLWAERWMVIHLLYGAQWSAAAGYLTYLLPIGLFDLGKNNLLQALVIKGRSKALFFFSVVSSAVVIGLILVGAHSGNIMTLVKLYALSKVLIWLPSCFAGTYVLEVPLSRVVWSQVGCLLPFWPVFVLTGVREAIVLNFGLSVRDPRVFVGFTLSYAVLALLCVGRIAQLKRFEFILKTFPPLERGLRRLGVLPESKVEPDPAV